MNSFRKWFKRNQNILSLVISVSAIIISLCSYFIAKNQFDLEKELNSVKFNLKEYPIRNPSSGMVDDHEISISLISGDVHNFSHEVINILEVNISDSLGIDRSHQFAFSNFYNSSFTVDDKLGLLRLIKGFENRKRFMDFQENLKTHNNGNSLVLNLKTYIKLFYMEFDDENKTSFYELSTLYTKSLPEKSGTEIFEKYSELKKIDKVIELYRPYEIDYNRILKMLAE